MNTYEYICSVTCFPSLVNIMWEKIEVIFIKKKSNWLYVCYWLHFVFYSFTTEFLLFSRSGVNSALTQKLDNKDTYFLKPSPLLLIICHRLL